MSFHWELRGPTRYVYQGEQCQHSCADILWGTFRAYPAMSRSALPLKQVMLADGRLTLMIGIHVRLG